MVQKLTYERHGGLYKVFNGKRELLGEIFLDPDWKKYVFHPIEKTIFARDCLQEIALFMRTLEVT